MDNSKTILVDEMLSHLKADFSDCEPNSQVAGFYANRSVFITGATGFIGKVIKKSNEEMEIEIGKLRAFFVSQNFLYLSESSKIP